MLKDLRTPNLSKRGAHERTQEEEEEEDTHYPIREGYGSDSRDADVTEVYQKAHKSLGIPARPLTKQPPTGLRRRELLLQI